MMTLTQESRGPVRAGSWPGEGGRMPGPGPRRPRHAAPGPPDPGPRPGRAPALTGILIAGAHGGAGTSTLAALLRAEIGACRPEARIPVRDLPALPDGDPRRIAAGTALPGRVTGPLILALRGTADGARRAVIAVTALGYLGIRPAALALVADGAGPLPKAAASRLDLIGDRAGPVIGIPFAAELRAGAEPGSGRMPARLLRAVAGLAELAVPQADGSRR
jgi:hypothetical protein